MSALAVVCVDLGIISSKLTKGTYRPCIWIIGHSVPSGHKHPGSSKSHTGKVGSDVFSCGLKNITASILLIGNVS